MRKQTPALLLTLLLTGACAPKVTERPFPTPSMEFGPKEKDTDLGQRLKQADSFQPNLTWQANTSTAVYLQQAENMVAIGQQTENEILINKGVAWIETFYKQPQAVSSMEFAKTPFASMAATETETDVKKALQEVNEDLDRSRAILKKNITESGAKYVWPVQGAKVSEILERAEGFTTLIYKQLGSMGLPSVVSEGVKAELKKQTGEIFTQIKPAAAELYQTTDYGKAMALLEDAITKLQIDLPDKVDQSLEQGRLIAKDLAALKDPQSGLTILIDIWKFLSAEERALNFKQENESLYDFLSKQSDSELNCLRRPDCSGGLFKGIAKKIFILPQIKQYGIENLRNKLNEKTLSYMITEVENQGLGFALDIPNILVEMIDEGLVEKNTELQKIQKNYPEYLRGLLGQWATGKLPNSAGKVPGFEAPLVSIKVSDKGRMSVVPSGATTELRGAAAGASLTANALLLKHSRSQQSDLKLRVALSMVNKLIAFGGYRDETKKLVPALMMPIEKTQTLLDLRELTKAQYAYRIPDKIKLMDSFRAGSDAHEKNFSAASYADQIKGLSEVLNITADWKKTAYDDTLGKIKAQELTSEIENPALARSLFPKDMIFALNIGDVAVLLKNITKKATPVFLLTLNQKTIWADQYGQDTTETNIMAGLVDIKDGQRATTVRLQDVAKFLLSLKEFLKAIDGIENTQSSLLLEKDETGVSGLQTLIESRRDLKLLTVALANFISNQLVNEQSLVQSSFYLNTLEKANDPNFKIEDQAYAIRALLAAWEVTGMEVYLWSAQDIYFAMNKHAYSLDQHFYVNGDRTALSFPQILSTVRALVEIKPSLPPASRNQLERILEPWLKGFQELQ